MVDDFSLHTDVFGLEDTHMYAMLLGTKKPRPFAGPVIASSVIQLHYRHLSHHPVRTADG